MAPRILKTPQSPSIAEIRFAIIQYLLSQTRSSAREEVKLGVYRLLGHQFQDVRWYELSGNNKPRWSERTGWEMDLLKKRGHIDNPKRDQWVLTPQGKSIISSSQCI